MGRGRADWLGIGTVCGEGQCGLVGNRDCMWGGAKRIGWETGLYVGRGSGDWLGMGTVCGEGQCGLVGIRVCMWGGQCELVGNRDCMSGGEVRIGWEWGLYVGRGSADWLGIRTARGKFMM